MYSHYSKLFEQLNVKEPVQSIASILIPEIDQLIAQHRLKATSDFSLDYEWLVKDQLSDDNNKTY